MIKIKKIHKIILLFILIFLFGVYSFTLYINNTIDQKKEAKEQLEIKGSTTLERQVTEFD